MADLEKLPDHHCFQNSTDATRCNDVGIRHQDELVQSGKEGLVFIHLSDEGVRLLLERQVHPDTYTLRFLAFLRSSSFIGSLHQAWAVSRHDIAAHVAERRAHGSALLVDFMARLRTGGPEDSHPIALAP